MTDEDPGKQMLPSGAHRLSNSGFSNLFNQLHAAGYTIIGPRLEQNAIVLDELQSAKDLPSGWGDEQEASTYRLRRRADQAYFGHNLGAESWKKFLYPRRQLLWRAQQSGAGLEFERPVSPPQALAFIGVRACDLAAIKIQARVHQGQESDQPLNPEVDRSVFIIAVNCAQATATCFCTSMTTGPSVYKHGYQYDLALTEFADVNDHHFIITAHTARGQAVLKQLPLQDADESAQLAVTRQHELTAQSMSRQLDLANPAEFFKSRLEHPAWEAIADRCLSCANCTMVCPTCFCTKVEDTTDLSGDHAERWLQWDSCFHLDFSHLHGGSVRKSTRSRYRQWLTHKLGTWHEQFGSSGCVGCGRCIAWCPVGIDLTAAVATLGKLPNNEAAPHERN